MITAHQESFAERLSELQTLLPAHYRELALNQDQVPLDPQYEVYLQKEKSGELLFTVLRENGAMIGYYIGFIAPALHYKTCLTCVMDIFYVQMDTRKQGAGLYLFAEVEKELKRRGVQRWFMGSKLHKDSSYLFEKIGAEKVEVYHSKWLGDE